MRDAQLQDPLVQAMIHEAAEEGARRALARVGLHDEDAGKDVADLREAIGLWRDAKRSVIKTIATAATMAVLAILSAGWAVRHWRE